MELYSSSPTVRSASRSSRSFKIPVNKWTLPTAALGGIFLIGFILLVMNYNHPFSKNARIYFTTTPIIPDVKGRVVDVPVKANELLEAGDILFRIDPQHYEFEVAQRAALAEAEQNVSQLKAGIDPALAAADGATAQRDATKKAFDRFNEGNENARLGGRGRCRSRWPMWKIDAVRTSRPKAPCRRQSPVLSRRALPTNRRSMACIPLWRGCVPSSGMPSTIST